MKGESNVVIDNLLKEFEVNSIETADPNLEVLMKAQTKNIEKSKFFPVR